MQHRVVDRPDLQLDPARVVKLFGQRNAVPVEDGSPMSTEISPFSCSLALRMPAWSGR